MIFNIFPVVFLEEIVYNAQYIKNNIKEFFDLKGNKLILVVVAAVVFIAAAATAIYIFRNEIADFFVDIKSRIDEKILHRDAEYVE